MCGRLSTLVLFTYCNVLLVQCGPLEVQTNYGPVVGFSKDNVDTWWGIPYASPPVGELRWRAPQPASNWSEPFNATVFPPACPQMKIYHRYFTGQEDCLVLNVYAPANRTTTKKLPVMVFIHGGSFKTGSGYGMYIIPQDELYDAKKFVNNRDVVFVAMNYRLGVFGWLALDQLRQEDPNGSSGNYGLQDQRFALQWVQRNIAAFGGDPDSIMLFGESAGAISVGYHYTSLESCPLFTTAIMESNVQGFQPAGGALNWTAASKFGSDYAQYVGCKQSDGKAQVACLRSRFAWEILDPLLVLDWPDKWQHDIPGYFFDWHPVVDGSRMGVMGTPEEQLSKGHICAKPVIIGSNRDDGDILLLKFLENEFTFNFTHQWLIDNLNIMFHKNQTLVNQCLMLYKSDGDPLNQAIEILGDAWTFCPPSHFLADLNKKFTNVPTYQYLFNQSIEHKGVRKLGAGHGFELPYVFQHPQGWMNWENTDYFLSNALQTYWSKFAHGNPNGINPSPYIDWPQWSYESGEQQFMVFQHHMYMTNRLRGDKCDFWNSFEFGLRNHIAAMKPSGSLIDALVLHRTGGPLPDMGSSIAGKKIKEMLAQLDFIATTRYQ